MRKNWFAMERKDGRGNMKLSDDDVIDIKVRLKNGEIVRSIRRDYAVGSTTLYNIKNGVTWSHIRVGGAEG